MLWSNEVTRLGSTVRIFPCNSFCSRLTRLGPATNQLGQCVDVAFEVSLSLQRINADVFKAFLNFQKRKEVLVSHGLAALSLLNQTVLFLFPFSCCSRSPPCIKNLHAHIGATQWKITYFKVGVEAEDYVHTGCTRVAKHHSCMGAAVTRPGYSGIGFFSPKLEVYKAVL